MPDVDKIAVAVLVSDIHLCLTPPVFRSLETDWLKVQISYLKELQGVYVGKSLKPLPIICGGDVFDKWNSPPELINLALKHLPKLYAVPGQHDLPNHNYDLLHKSAFWSLVIAGVITPIEVFEGEPTTIEGPFPLALWGYPWGFEIQEPTIHSMYLNVCVSHSYICTKDTAHPKATEESRLRTYKKKLKNYDVALFGDNHKPLHYNLEKTRDGVTIFNPGSFMVRTSDQRDFNPRVGVLYNDGSVVPHYLDVTKDKYLPVVKDDDLTLEDHQQTIALLAAVIKEGQQNNNDFEGLLNRALGNPNVPPGVRRIVTRAME